MYESTWIEYMKFYHHFIRLHLTLVYIKVVWPKHSDGPSINKAVNDNTLQIVCNICNKSDAECVPWK